MEGLMNSVMGSWWGIGLAVGLILFIAGTIAFFRDRKTDTNTQQLVSMWAIGLGGALTVVSAYMLLF